MSYDPNDSSSSSSASWLQEPLIWSLAGAVLLAIVGTVYYTQSPEVTANNNPKASNKSDFLDELGLGDSSSMGLSAADIDSSNVLLNDLPASDENNDPNKVGRSTKSLRDSTNAVLNILNSASKGPIGNKVSLPDSALPSFGSALGNGGAGGLFGLGQFGRDGRLQANTFSLMAPTQNQSTGGAGGLQTGSQGSGLGYGMNGLTGSGFSGNALGTNDINSSTGSGMNATSNFGGNFSGNAAGVSGSTGYNNGYSLGNSGVNGMNTTGVNSSGFNGANSTVNTGMGASTNLNTSTLANPGLAGQNTTNYTNSAPPGTPIGGTYNSTDMGTSTGTDAGRLPKFGSANPVTTAPISGGSSTTTTTNTNPSTYNAPAPIGGTDSSTNQPQQNNPYRPQEGNPYPGQ